jgi:hypothetical protein
MGVMKPDLVMRNIIPVIMAGVLGIYGLIVAVILNGTSECTTFEDSCSHFLYFKLILNLSCDQLPSPQAMAPRRFPHSADMLSSQLAFAVDLVDLLLAWQLALSEMPAYELSASARSFSSALFLFLFSPRRSASMASSWL